ncbi:MAG: IPT/TIG domain-containing protein, partial [Bacteroidota bacterium]
MKKTYLLPRLFNGSKAALYQTGCKETGCPGKGFSFRTGILAILCVLVNLIFTNTAEAAIAQRGSATTASITGTSVNVNVPSNIQQNDVMIINIEQGGNTTTDPTCTNWHLISGAVVDAGGKSRRMAVLYKIADASEPTYYTFTLGSGVSEGSAAMIAFSGVDQAGGFLVGGSAGGPFDVAPGAINAPQTATTTATANAISTAHANAAVIMLAGMMDGTAGAAYSSWSTTTPGALTELYDYNGGAESIGAAWATDGSTGTTGNGTVTIDASKKWGAILLALKPLSNPVPAITSISPTTKCAGDAGFTLTVNGSNFIASSVVRIGGSDRTTTFVNSGQLTATINASDIASSGTPAITVFNPTPGGGTSGSSTLTVNPVITGNTSGSAVSICTGTATTLTGGTVSGGSGSYTYLWESSASSSSGFTTATGASTNASYTTPTLATSSTQVYFRRTVTSGACTNVATAVLVTVNPVITGNTSGSAVSICTGTSTTLTGGTVSGGSGSYTYLWESSSSSSSGFT